MPASRRSFLNLPACVAPVRALLCFVALLSIGNAKAVLEVGEIAPAIELPTPEGATKKIAPAPGRIQLLLFVKPADKHTSTALSGIATMLGHEPELAARIDPCVVVLRHSADAKLPAAPVVGGSTWPRLIDVNGATFEGYRIIVTPTVVGVGEDGHVAVIHAGYDHGMLQDLRLGLAQHLKVELDNSARGEAIAPPDMTIKMARRLGQRRLWDQALVYYTQAEAKGTLTAEDRLDIARIQLEIHQPDAALKSLDAITSAATLTTQTAELRAKALAQKQNMTVPQPAATPKAPAVR